MISRLLTARCSKDGEQFAHEAVTLWLGTVNAGPESAYVALEHELWKAMKRPEFPSHCSTHHATEPDERLQSSTWRRCTGDTLEGKEPNLRPSGRVLVLAVLLALTLSSAPFPVRALAGSPGTGVRLSLTGHCFSVRLRPTFVQVNLGYVHPQKVYRFAFKPSFSGFGGGNMGLHRADSHGIVTFPYQVPDKRTDVGMWRVSAYYRGRVVASNDFVVMQGSCTRSTSKTVGVGRLAGIVGRYFGYLTAHRDYAAWQLEAPCRVTFSVPNGPGSPVGSESYPGKAPWTIRLPRLANQRILVSARVASITQLHIPVLDRNHVLAFAVRGWFHFDYSAIGSAASFNNRHNRGFHIVKIAVWQCNGRWGIEPSYWLVAGGGELNWK
jgi:hypothetical protein